MIINYLNIIPILSNSLKDKSIKKIEVFQQERQFDIRKVSDRIIKK